KTGTLLSVVDRTLTAAGGRMLARWLSAPLLELNEISARQDSVEELAAGAVLREELAEQLRGVLDVERLLGRLAIGQGIPRDLAALRPSPARMPACGSRLAACGSKLLGSLAPPLGAVEDLRQLLERALADEMPAGRFEPGFVRRGFRPELDELSELAHGG